VCQPFADPSLERRNAGMPEKSADRSDRELLADPLGQAIVDFGVTGDRGFCAGSRIGINRVPATLARASSNP